MRTCAELDVLPAKGCDLAIPEARLNGDEQQRLIPPSDPVEFEVLEKLPQEGNIEILDEQFGWRTSKALKAEPEE